MTCNPEWEDIAACILLFNDISKKHIFGVPTAKVHVIEFKKKGLQHAHILLIDTIVSAEIPDIDHCPRLHAIVSKHMIHGLCGAHNVNNGKHPVWLTKTFQKIPRSISV